MKRSNDGDLEEISSIKFIRNFEHIDGNWPSHIKIPIELKTIKVFVEASLHFLLETYSWIPRIDQIVIEESPHISLSKPFILRYHQIQAVIKELDSCITQSSKFKLTYKRNFEFLVNESKTRLFFCLPIEPNEILLTSINQTNQVLKAFNQPSYYENPHFHISIASCNCDEDLYENVKPFLNTYITIPQINQLIPCLLFWGKDETIPFLCQDQVLSLLSGYDSDPTDDNPELNGLNPITLSLPCEYRITINEIHCMIGKRLYSKILLNFGEINSSSISSNFVEIFLK